MSAYSSIATIAALFFNKAFDMALYDLMSQQEEVGRGYGQIRESRIYSAQSADC